MRLAIFKPFGVLDLPRPETKRLPALTDVVYPEVDGVDIQRINESLSASGLITLATTDIAKNVLKSRELAAGSAPLHRALNVWARGRKLNLDVLCWMFFLPSTESHQGLMNGTIQYWSWKLQKPLGASTP